MRFRWAWLCQVVYFTKVILLISKGASGETCSFTEMAGQKGEDSLRMNSGDMTTDVTGCKTLCNTTELCIAGEFLSSTKICYMYSLETSLTAQPDTVFFLWDICNETATTPATTTVSTTATTAAAATTTPASISTKTPGQRLGLQYNEKGAIGSSVAGLAVLCVTVPCIVYMICARRKIRRRGRNINWSSYTGRPSQRSCPAYQMRRKCGVTVVYK